MWSGLSANGGNDAKMSPKGAACCAGADEDTRRAMNKSFQESNGTVLSTNWKDIGAKKTEHKAPEGADEKAFEY